MNKLSPRNLLVAAVLFGIAAESAWSEEATPSVPAAPAEQTASPGTGHVPEYVPSPNRRGYEQYWQQPPQWREPPPPPGYGHFRPYYPPYRQYRPAPAAPAENPLGAEHIQTQEQLATKDTELNSANEQLVTLQAEQQASNEALQQAQEQLAAKDTELNTAREQLAALRAEQQASSETLQQAQEQLSTRNTERDTARVQLATLQVEQQAIREAMEQAQAETDKASEQLSVVVEEMDILIDVLAKLKARLDVQNTSLLGALQAAAEENDKVDSADASDAEQMQSPTTPSVQPENAGGEHTQAGGSEPTKPKGE